MPGSVVSVNVGRAAPLPQGKRTVTSAIRKAPVLGPVAVSGVNVDGDEQADRVNHGGPEQAVYAYAQEDTAWWEAELGRALGPGTFGENLTLAGVDVSGARIGERWRIGTVELQVAGPRTPCMKLAARMGDLRFVKRFTEALRPGAYLAIAGVGELQAGDAVEVVHRPAHDVTPALVMEIALLAPERAAELEPARPDFLPKVAAWVAGRTLSRG
jgi:MOSC domain-containing protein YiiM